MGNFLKKLFLTLLVIILVISTTALGVLFVVRTNDWNNSQNEVSKTKDDLKKANDKIIELQAAAKDPNAKLTLSDKTIGYTVKYPASWTPVLDTKTDTEESSAGMLRRVELVFTKDSSSVKFTRLFGGIGDVAVGYPSSKYDVKVLNDKVIRVADKGTTSWSYKAKVNCKDALEVPAGTEVCGSGSFFPGFGTQTGSAGFASAEVKDTALLDEADGIVLSAVN